jgi:hypothetical protein
MSADITSWKTGASQALVSRRAIVFRIEVSCSTSGSAAGVGAAAGAAGAAAGAGAATARSTS